MKKFRVIYAVESYTGNGDLVFRRFARNKKTAEKISNQCERGTPYIFKVRKADHQLISEEDVEG